ncbi:hypothetical protein [Nitrosomonas ureae]|nr:hypothetical protein [Nitrosomonas ureae]
MAQQVLGTFKWNLYPFCNILTVTVTKHDISYTAIGEENHCGIYTSPVRGSFVEQFRNDMPAISGSFTLESSIFFSRILIFIENIDEGLNGVWQDTSGNSGNLIFNPTQNPGLPRSDFGDFSARINKDGNLIFLNQYFDINLIKINRSEVGKYCIKLPYQFRFSKNAAQLSLISSSPKIGLIQQNLSTSCIESERETVLEISIFDNTGILSDSDFSIYIPQPQFFSEKQ